VAGSQKIVYSRRFRPVSSARTRIEREFDRDAVRRLKRSSGADIAVGGAELAGHAIGAGWSTSAICSCARSWWEAASAPCQITSARNSNFSMSAGSETASFTSTTA